MISTTSKAAIKVSDTQTVKNTGQIYDSGTYLTKNWIEKAPAGVNTFAIQDTTKSTSIKLNGTGDTVFIEGDVFDYVYKQNDKVITLTDTHHKITITLSNLSTKATGEVEIELVFSNGSVTIGNTLGSTQLKVYAFSNTPTAEIFTFLNKNFRFFSGDPDFNNTSADYFSDHTSTVSKVMANDKDLSSTASVQIDLIGISPDTVIN